MAINLHEKYSSHVQERFYKESITQASFSKDLDVEFNGVRSVKVSMIDTVPLNDYDRTLTTGDRYGPMTELSDTVQEFIMTQDKAFNFSIDKGNNLEQQMIKNAGRAINRELREVVTPTIDKYRLEKWAAGAGTSKSVTAPTKDTIFGQIVDAKTAMDNAMVPMENRTVYVGSVAYKALLQSTEFLTLEKTGNKVVTKGEVGQVLGMSVKYVPDSYLPSKVVFMVVLKDAAISPVKLHEYKVHKDPPGLSGHKCEGRFIYDAFVRDTKKMGIYVATTA